MGRVAARVTSALFVIEGILSFVSALLMTFGYYFSAIIYGFPSPSFSRYVQGNETTFTAPLAMGFFFLAVFSIAAFSSLSSGRGGRGFVIFAALFGIVLVLASSALIPMMAGPLGLFQFLLCLSALITTFFSAK